MLLNEFLEFKLGVVFEDKYNILAMEEIINHKDRYPLISQTVDNMADYDKDGKLINTTYDSSYFDCDDPDLCADYEATIELYKAFITVFGHDFKNSKMRLRSITFGVGYLSVPNNKLVYDRFVYYSGIRYITVLKHRRTIGEKIFYQPSKLKKTNHKKETDYTFFCPNEALLRQIRSNMINMSIFDNLENQPFELTDHNKTILDNGVEGYPFDFVDLSIGKNYIKLFTTQRGFDVFSPVFRNTLFDALTKEEIKMDITDAIIHPGY